MPTHKVIHEPSFPRLLEHEFDFDPLYGYSNAQLLEIEGPQPPSDFAEFWEKTYAEAMEVNVAPQLKPSQLTVKGAKVQEVSFTSWEGVTIGGWVTTPTEGPIRRCFVNTHGYGGRETPEVHPAADAAIIWPCMRGLSKSPHPKIPHDAGLHVLAGIESRETYSIRGCVADIWCAATAIRELFPDTSERIGYTGGSFGGGLGPLAMAWDKRFAYGNIGVPTFGNHPLRLKLKCVGSGEPVRLYSQKHPEVIDVLRYFDSASMARLVKVPMFAAPAFFDPAVAPPGQFSTVNCLGGDTDIFIKTAGHFEYEGQAEEGRHEFEALQRFYRKHT